MSRLPITRPQALALGIIALVAIPATVLVAARGPSSSDTDDPSSATVASTSTSLDGDAPGGGGGGAPGGASGGAPEGGGSGGGGSGDSPTGPATGDPGETTTTAPGAELERVELSAVELRAAGACFPDGEGERFVEGNSVHVIDRGGGRERVEGSRQHGGGDRPRLTGTALGAVLLPGVEVSDAEAGGWLTHVAVHVTVTGGIVIDYARDHTAGDTGTFAQSFSFEGCTVQVFYILAASPA